MRSIGAVRGVGDDCKSVARLLCPQGDTLAHEGWATDYIRSTCKVMDGSASVKVLGTFVGGTPDAANEGLRRALRIQECLKRLLATRSAAQMASRSPTQLGRAVLARRVKRNKLYIMIGGNLRIASVGLKPSKRSADRLRAIPRTLMELSSPRGLQANGGNYPRGRFKRAI